LGPVGVELRGGAALEDARRRLLEAGREELVAVFGRVARADGRLLFLVQEAEQAPEEYVWRDGAGLHWKPELTRRWTQRIEESGQGIALLHAHGGKGKVRLSKTDEVTCARMLGHFPRFVPDQAHGYVVVGAAAATGWFTFADEKLAMVTLKTVTCPIRRWNSDPAEVPAAPPTMARQAAAITELGQARMWAATVGIVGIGGGGSNVVDQLSHMGIGHLILCEADVIKDVNLSRQTGAGPSNLGAAKADVSAAAVRHANPEIRLTVIKERFPGPQSYAALRTADVIVTCVDGATARHEVNKFCRRLLIPVIDIGATIRRKDGFLRVIAGHAARLLPDGACMECEELTTPALREKERAGRDVPYFEGVEEAGAPQVMSINGVLASLASTEVLRLIAGLTEDRVSVHLRYEALVGEVYPREPVTPGCLICEMRGMGDSEG
jgi:molybdopterin-synthase adenylyltransferase